MAHLFPTIRRVPRKAGPVAALTTLLAVGLTLTPAAASNADHTETARPKPTIVLEHGAFADASGWNAVIHALQKRGYTVYAPANPLRSLSGDTEYLKSFLATVPGPVILVGHSYGGAVITGAATGDPAVKNCVPGPGLTARAGHRTAYSAEQGVLLHQARPRPGQTSGVTGAVGVSDGLLGGGRRR
ncbi:esterase/lipase family protein [Streptomyces sp. NPDC002742]|uniref:esterase/lipase family protein n=1 Tax=Streptomyces sp. NPDC002742 TaxID=3364663 RepID=UPI0036C7E140